VNSAQVISNWLVGREIVEDEQRGKRRASYQHRVLERLAARMQKEFGSGYSLANIRAFRQFYLVYPAFIAADAIRYPLGSEFTESIAVPHSDGMQPGQFSPNLSWRHYRTLMRFESMAARAFYEIDAVRSSWSARELERQAASLLYERLANSRDKIGVMRLATEGADPEKPAEIFKDPTVIEFLGLPETPALTESSLESALLSNLQAFLLELGSGFAFVARQQRITLDGDHFYVDLVFYHSVLKCYVLADLKVGKLTHGDLGQLQLYVNFYDLERRAPDDNPTLGLILCSDKNDAVVKYSWVQIRKTRFSPAVTSCICQARSTCVRRSRIVAKGFRQRSRGAVELIAGTRGECEHGAEADVRKDSNIPETPSSGSAAQIPPVIWRLGKL